MGKRRKNKMSTMHRSNGSALAVLISPVSESVPPAQEKVKSGYYKAQTQEELELCVGLRRILADHYEGNVSYMAEDRLLSSPTLTWAVKHDCLPIGDLARKRLRAALHHPSQVVAALPDNYVELHQLALEIQRKLREQEQQYIDQLEQELQAWLNTRGVELTYNHETDTWDLVSLIHTGD